MIGNYTSISYNRISSSMGTNAPIKSQTIVGLESITEDE